MKASGTKNLEQMFLGEALGLRALRASGTMAVPEVFNFADGFDGGSYVIMEFMDFSGRAEPAEFGRSMAQMHAAEPLAKEAKDGKFGFQVDNTIGDTPQPNAWTSGSGTAAWVEFFREKRIGHQVRLASDARMRKQWDTVLEATDGLATLFEGIDVKPSVLHGDLCESAARAHTALAYRYSALLTRRAPVSHRCRERQRRVRRRPPGHLRSGRVLRAPRGRVGHVVVRQLGPGLLEGLPRAHPEG